MNGRRAKALRRLIRDRAKRSLSPDETTAPLSRGEWRRAKRAWSELPASAGGAPSKENQGGFGRGS